MVWEALLESLANRLRDTGPAGQERAALLPNTQPDKVDGIFAVAAQALWLDRVKPELDRRKRTHSPAIPRIANERLMLVSSKLGQWSQPSGGQPVLEHNRRVIARYHPSAQQAIVGKIIDEVQRGQDAVARHAGQTLLRWIVRTAWEQWCALDEKYYAIRIPGGYQGLADRLGLSSNKDRALLCDAVEYLRGLTIPINRHNVELVLCTIPQDSAPGMQRLIIFQPSVLLLPQAPSDKELSLGRLDKRLCPVFASDRLAPPIGHRKHSWQQDALLWLTGRVLSDHAEEYAERGGIHLPSERRLELAGEVGIDRRKATRVWERWVSPTSRGQQQIDPFLVEQGGGRIALGPGHKDAEQLIIAQGRARIVGRRQGSRAAERKRRKLQS
jgi:hypothetical protein